MSKPFVAEPADNQPNRARASRLGRLLALVVAVAIGFAAAACMAQTGPEARRVALVIGNGAYQQAPALLNPANDARDMAAKLEGLGFEVTLGLDVAMQGFGETLRDFSRSVEGADVALLFYAGHGVQVDGVNYLIPVDAEIEAASDLEFHAVKADAIIGLMDRAAGLSLIFLDACRNNPLTRSLSRSAAAPAGLAPQNVASGSFIAFATAPGNVALDGEGARNSPFTTALLRNIDRPDVDIRLMMADVRAEVFAATSEQQLPWENNSLIGRFYFRTDPEGAAPRALDDAALAERDAFDAARAAGGVAALEAFLAAHPDGLFAGVARDALAALRQPAEAALSLDEIFWRTIRDSVLPADFALYLDLFDDGGFRDLAQARIAALHNAATIQDYVFEDGERLDTRAGIQRAALDKADQLPLSFVQYGLIALGFPVPDPAGVLDAATRAAARSYQASVGAPQTGRLTPRQILDLILVAAAIGDQHAETALGVMTASGIGLEQDDSIARHWLGRAADQGNGYAQANLAVLYRDGRGGAPDMERARSLFEAAVAQGLNEAEPLLRALDG